MPKSISPADQAEFTKLRGLSACIGRDLRFTQASSGNSSIKLESNLWIKASGRWMADALHDNVFIPLNLAEVKEFVNQKIDPAQHCAGASIETAMHAVLPHRVVLHLHCVNTIAWAVRRDAPAQLEKKLDGLHWCWIPYVASGLPLALEIEKTAAMSPAANIFVLSNHGLVVCGENCADVTDLLAQVERRLAIAPRMPKSADYTSLEQIAAGSSWMLPVDCSVHALGTDSASQAVLSGGLLFPGQSFCSNSSAAELFRPVPRPDDLAAWMHRYASRPFLIIQGCGVIVSQHLSPTQEAMMSGLAQIIQRINPAAPLRYLSEDEVANSYGVANPQYREITNACRSRASAN